MDNKNNQNPNQTEKNSEEIMKYLNTTLTEGMVATLRAIFTKGSEYNLAMSTLIFKICEIQEASYTYKAIHEDIDKDTRDMYISMARLAKQTPMVFMNVINMITKGNDVNNIKD